MFVAFGIYDFVQISPACGTNKYLSNNVWWDFQFQHISNGNRKEF